MAFCLKGVCNSLVHASILGLGSISIKEKGPQYIFRRESHLIHSTDLNSGFRTQLPTYRKEKTQIGKLWCPPCLKLQIRRPEVNSHSRKLLLSPWDLCTSFPDLMLIRSKCCGCGYHSLFTGFYHLLLFGESTDLG